MDNFDEYSGYDEYETEDTAAQTPSEEGGSGEAVQAGGCDKSPENAVNVFFDAGDESGSDSAFPEDFFWADVVTAGSRSGKPKTFPWLPVVIAVSFVMGALLMVTAFYGKGWFSSHFGKNKNVEFTLPIVDRPELEDEYYQEDGRYTAQGVAKALEDSVVSVITYSMEDQYFSKGQGSGIIMSEDGYIVTNAHVISGSSDGGIKVRLSDESEYYAVIVGSDERTDIAVIKIEASGLKPAQFGNSDQVQLGEEVIAIGNPAGLGGSVSKGIVSGLDREIRVDEDHEKMNCIQIDAAINPGNSGGALVNMWGQVIGITSSKLSSDSYYGIGFAITINDAKPIIENLMEYGCIPGRVRIGITFYQITEDIAEEYGATAGLLIEGIDEECDIANSGIMAGDVITHLDGVRVTDSEAVDKVLEGKKAGDTITATVERNGEVFETQFKLMDDSSSLKVKED